MAILNHKKINIKTFFATEDLIQEITKVSPAIIAIDAPLSLPKGRCCLEKECNCSIRGHFRDSDKKIREFGPVLPLTFIGMKMLTFRGMNIKERLKKIYPQPKIIEVHPHTSQKILNIGEDKKTIYSNLSHFFALEKTANELSEHELDAIIAALTGLYYHFGKFKELGDVSEGTIIVPVLELDFNTDILFFKKI